MCLRALGVSCAALLLSLSAATASTFTGITSFGDSLSDNGNASILTNGSAPGPNYGNHTFASGLTTTVFSDGPNTTPKAAGSGGVWVDQLAPKLGLADPPPALKGGTNYAVGGAESGSGAQNVGTQIALFNVANLGSASSTDLYTFWAGANDILDGKNPVTAADNIAGYIQTLHGEGAQTFLWLNLPPLGDTPSGAAQKDALNAAATAFNGKWSVDLAGLQANGIHVIGVDIDSLFSNIIGNPSAYGFSNVTSMAQGANVPTDAGYLFWDGRHPTNAGHALVADAALAALNATATPEPATFALLGSGFALVTVAARLRRRAVRRRLL